MRNTLFILLIGVLGFAILMSLGFWQLRRLDWKVSKISEAEIMMAAEPIALPTHLDPLNDRFRPVKATGIFTGEELHVLTSTREDGPGFRIISPLVLEDGRRILVDRGFVPEYMKKTVRPGHVADVVGNLNWPDDMTSGTPEPDVAANMWFGRDVPAMAKVLHTEEVMIIARDATGDSIMPMPATAAFKNDHLSYAVTWFGLALVWAGMTLGFLWRIRTRQV